VQARFIHEVEDNEANAYMALARAAQDGSAASISAATTALHQNSSGAAAASMAKLRQRAVQLAADLNISVGAQALGNQDPALNMPSIDTPLSDAAFLLARFASISAKSTEAARLVAIDELVNWEKPLGEGSFYVSVE
jgi:hypothetical protein